MSCLDQSSCLPSHLLLDAVGPLGALLHETFGDCQVELLARVRVRLHLSSLPVHVAHESTIRKGKDRVKRSQFLDESFLLAPPVVLPLVDAVHDECQDDAHQGNASAVSQHLNLVLLLEEQMNPK